MDEKEKQSGIRCKLTGENGNIFNLLGIARQALRNGGRSDLVEPLTNDVTSSQSYEEALARIMEYVVVE